MKITVLNARQMSEVFSMKDAIQADKDALQLYSEGKSTIPLRANLDIQKYNGQTLYMYGYAEPAKASGVKIVSVYPDNIEKGLTSVPATMIPTQRLRGRISPPLRMAPGSPVGIPDSRWLAPVKKEYPFASA